MTADSLPVISPDSPGSWHDWLATNHANSNGVWLRMFKKNSAVRSLTYDEALDEALCYGWIDGQKRTFDEKSWIQKFTPRRARSGWSKRNTEHAERLIEAGKMQPAGLAQVEAAKRDGRWDQAYQSPAAGAMPEDFVRALNENPQAKVSFETLNRRNSYPIVYRLQTAKKPETRERRLREIIAMLERGEKFYP